MLGIHRFALSAAAQYASGCERGQVPRAIPPARVASWAGVGWRRGVKMELTKHTAFGCQQARPHYVHDNGAPPISGAFSQSE